MNVFSSAEQMQRLTVVGAGEDGEFNLVNIGVFSGSSLGGSLWTSVIRPTHGELITVGGEWSQSSGFDLRTFSPSGGRETVTQEVVTLRV